MLLTAHRVVSSRTRRAGINAFRYTHDGIAGIDWTNPDPATIADTGPGALVADDVDVAPGGNLVRSYLDVVAHDQTPWAELDRALDSARALLDETLPLVVRGEIAIRLGAELGLPNESWRAEFDELWRRAIRLLTAPPTATWRAAEPLTIRLQISEEGTSFDLDPGSIERLRREASADWTPTTIRVRNEVRDDLVFYRGDILRDLVRSLLPDIPEEQLLRLGGVRVVDSADRLVVEWPVRRTVGAGYCLHCHRHNTLVASGTAWQCQSCGRVQSDNGLWVTALS